MDTRQWHYITPNETTNVPRRFVFLDTEARIQRDPSGHTQTWALAVACFRAQRPDRTPQELWETFDDPEFLWQAVDRWVGKSGRTVLWTHNLGYDSRISEMFDILPRMGFHLIAHNLIGKGTWLMWRRGRASLTMVDSASVFPVELIRLGQYLGLPKLKLPPESAHGVGLYSRCWRDVEILRTAVLEYLQWIEDEDLGNWQITGAGQSWATFRHRFMDRRLLVHNEVDVLAAERRAMWTGRCEAYWRGELSFQVVHEWDFTLAYSRIARDVNVPVRLIGPMPEDYDWRAVLTSTRTGLLVECEVTTEVPVVPTMMNGRIVWPVGTFTTTLWDVEVKQALDEGASVIVHKGWLYHLAPALKTWAEWLIGQLDDLADLTDHWKYIVLKHQARALIGRMAMTYTKWEEYATSPTPMVRAHQVYDSTTDETFRTVQIGHTMWRDAGAREWGESMPMVTGYIQSVCRVRLRQLCLAAPNGSVLYVDTDSILVTDMHSAAIAAIADAHPEWGLRLKRSWQGFAVWGPRQIRTGTQVRVSGVSKHAHRTGPTTLEGDVWESLHGALHRGNPTSVVIRDRVWTLQGVDHRRVGTGLGWTQPHRLPQTGPAQSTPGQEELHDPSSQADPRAIPARTAGRSRPRPGPDEGQARTVAHRRTGQRPVPPSRRGNRTAGHPGAPATGTVAR